MPDHLRTTLGARGPSVCRIGLSASYRPGDKAVRRALDEGVNYLFCYAVDNQMTRVVRDLNADRREKICLATGGYNWIAWHPPLRKSLERALRRLKTDYIDVFHYLGVMKPRHFGSQVRDELAELRRAGRIRAVAISCHDRKFAGELAASGELDVVMVRYNAAHPGAERDVFPQAAAHGVGVVSYTATRWTYLLRRPKGWPASEAVATAGQCYRFVLSNPDVHVVLTAPRSEEELVENLNEAARGPLPEDEMAFMRRFGAYVHDRAGWFMGG